MNPKPTCALVALLLLDLAKGVYVAAAVCAVRACGLVMDCMKGCFLGRSCRLIAELQAGLLFCVATIRVH